MSAQLELAAVVHRDAKPPKKAKPSPAAHMCKCGHDDESHTNGTGRCLPCKVIVDAQRAEMGPLRQAKLCTRFRSKSRKPPPIPLDLLGPLGSFPIWRPDTVNPKAMGWGSFEENPVASSAGEPPFDAHETRWIFYLSQLRTESKNTFHVPDDPHVAKRVILGKKARASANGRWAEAAMRQIAEREGFDCRSQMPHEILLTRVSFGHPDQDNLHAHLAFVRDGVCAALGFDDGRTIQCTEPKLERAPAGYSWIRYAHGHSFKTGVFGVRVEVLWRAT